MCKAIPRPDLEGAFTYGGQKYYAAKVIELDPTVEMKFVLVGDKPAIRFARITTQNGGHYLAVMTTYMKGANGRNVRVGFDLNKATRTSLQADADFANVAIGWGISPGALANIVMDNVPLTLD